MAGRMIPKALKKVLLINWFYYGKQLVEFGDINFLTGKTGSGKTTFIDALQIVLYGETNYRNFNRAAKNEVQGSSSRNIESYLYTDLPEDNPASRKGRTFSSYIACEFEDRINHSSFVTGVVFDCEGSGAPGKHYFIFQGGIPDHCFAEDGVAMDYRRLRAFFDANKHLKAEVFSVEKEYRNKMLARWNVHNDQILRLLKKGVGFEPIANIEKFITENVCDLPQRPDIQEMQQNIRDYKRQEKIAQREEAKKEKLEVISSVFGKWKAAADQKQQEDFLLAWSEIEVVRDDLNRLERDKKKCEDEFAQAQSVHAQMKEEEENKDAEYLECRSAYENSNINLELKQLNEREASLKAEDAGLRKNIEGEVSGIRREADRISAICRTVIGLDNDESADPLRLSAERAVRAYSPFLRCTPDIFSTDSPAGFKEAVESAGELSAKVSDFLHETGAKLKELRAEESEKQKVLADLRSNIKDYPKDLLLLKKRLQAETERESGGSVRIDILADVLEIVPGQEGWRGAVEGYLNTQKFYLLIDPQYYETALKIYDRIKGDFSRSSFGLVDIGKLVEREKIDARPDSLARKIGTESRLARVYIDYLLGRVICCDRVEQLREHRTAITAEGMVYQNYVARPIRRALMEDTFIGRDAIALRIRKVENEIAEIRSEIQAIKPGFDALSPYRDKMPMFSEYYYATIGQRMKEYVRRTDIASEIRMISERKSRLDLRWLEEQRKRVEKLYEERQKIREEIAAHDRHMGEIQNQLTRLSVERIPERQRNLAELENGTAIKAFDDVFKETVGIPRYEAEIQKHKRASAIFRYYKACSEETADRHNKAERELFKKRREYVEQFDPCPFSIESRDNSEYDDELERLEVSSLPKYREKIQKARDAALEMFQSDFVSKIKANIDQVRDKVGDLNRALRRFQFGTDSYQFRISPSVENQDYYAMIMDPELMLDEGGLFASSFQDKYGTLMGELFNKIADADDETVSAKRRSQLQENIDKFTDFRTYLKFDLEMTDVNGSKQMLSQTLNTKSGGEMQTPFYIAMLSSFAQAYRINDTSKTGETVRLVVFDEAFNKMDSEHVTESVRLLRAMGLQAIISTPEDKIADIMDLADRTLLALPDRSSYAMRMIPWEKDFANDATEDNSVETA